MRKSVVAVAAILGAGLLSACGGASDEPTTEASTPPAETQASSEPAEVTPTAAPAESEGSSEFAGLPEPYASADYDRGKRVFLQCQSCHTLDEGGATVLGPNLYGLFGRKVGEASGFDYSEALQNADFEGTPEKLDEWLTRPRDFLPGNKMSFAGVTRPDDRTAVIAYVMSKTGYEASE